jgi:hypothetical protein
MSTQALSVAKMALSVFHGSAGSMWTTPPGTRRLLTGQAFSFLRTWSCSRETDLLTLLAYVSVKFAMPWKWRPTAPRGQFRSRLGFFQGDLQSGIGEASGLGTRPLAGMVSSPWRGAMRGALLVFDQRLIRSVINSFTRCSISSRIDRTASTSLPAGFSTSQSR